VGTITDTEEGVGDGTGECVGNVVGCAGITVGTVTGTCDGTEDITGEGDGDVVGCA